MNAKWRWAILGGLWFYLLGLGFLGGIAAERVRFDSQRMAVLSRYDEAVREWHAYLIKLERGLPAEPQRADDGGDETAEE